MHFCRFLLISMNFVNFWRFFIIQDWRLRSVQMFLTFWCRNFYVDEKFPCKDFSKILKDYLNTQLQKFSRKTPDVILAYLQLKKRLESLEICFDARFQHSAPISLVIYLIHILHNVLLLMLLLLHLLCLDLWIFWMMITWPWFLTYLK